MCVRKMLDERETDALETMFTAGRRTVRACRACKQLKSARARGSTLRTYTLSITVHSLEAGITHLVLHEGSLKRVLSAQACRACARAYMGPSFESTRQRQDQVYLSASGVRRGRDRGRRRA
jgi:hypothetical protein